MKHYLIYEARRRLLNPLSSYHPPTLNFRHCLSSLNSSVSSSDSYPTNNKLFVGGLSWSVDEKALGDAFASYGEVTEVRIMYDRETGRSRGFGFVNFSKEDEATTAKDAMDGKAFLGRPLRITFAFDKVHGVPVVVPRVRAIQNQDLDG